MLQENPETHETKTERTEGSGDSTVVGDFAIPTFNVGQNDQAEDGQESWFEPHYEPT